MMSEYLCPKCSMPVELVEVERPSEYSEAYGFFVEPPVLMGWYCQSCKCVVIDPEMESK